MTLEDYSYQMLSYLHFRIKILLVIIFLTTVFVRHEDSVYTVVEFASYVAVIGFIFGSGKVPL